MSVASNSSLYRFPDIGSTGQTRVHTIRYNADHVSCAVVSVERMRMLAQMLHVWNAHTQAHLQLKLPRLPALRLCD